ncbi:MAG: nicotinate-nucleotide adenylyltransferase [Eubacteriales bacterium]|nr:nicotinate-nucleotide adenylyltransferase [Eubacteriales bacterium]
MRKIGILGGTFDPIHNGHIGLAEDAVNQVGLDEVIMIPAKIQPFKQQKKIESGEDRFQMLALVASQNDYITVSRNELDNEGVSYTYLTLRRMQEKNPDAKLYFICGSDSFPKVSTWKNAAEILDNYSFIVGCDRPGYRHEELEKAIRSIKSEHDTDILIISNRQFDISSTEIRDRLAEGRTIADLVPAPVERYIIQHGLYGA